MDEPWDESDEHKPPALVATVQGFLTVQAGHEVSRSIRGCVYPAMWPQVTLVGIPESGIF